eukprot:646162-Rhodomonas_salina.1
MQYAVLTKRMSMVLCCLPTNTLRDVQYCQNAWCSAICLPSPYAMSGPDLAYGAGPRFDFNSLDMEDIDEDVR